jgi:diguanylate cyclase (GGDEF)-like protein/PAS domain S-box-containing protein
MICIMPIGSSKILIIDDEDRIRSGLSAVLLQAGYEIACAATGRDAMTLLSENDFGLALLDINLPDVSGQQVLDFIRRREIDTFVIMVSGESTFEQATAALRKGAADFIAKPYDPQKLLDTISSVLKKRQRKKEYLKIQERLQGSEELHRFIVDNSPDLIFMLDEQGYFSFLNERSRQLLGCQSEDFLGRHFSEIVLNQDIEKVSQSFRSLNRGGHQATRSMELRLRPRNGGDVRHVEVWAISVEMNSLGVYATQRDPGRPMAGIYGVARDISDRKQSEELRRYHLYHDQLTNLPNRALFSDRLQIALGQARRKNQQLAVMFLDIDRFKMINDLLGHLAGDELLQKVAQRLKDSLREGDTLARISGDEFTLLAPDIDGIDAAGIICRKIQSVFDQPFQIHGQTVRVTFSIGYAVYPHHGQTREMLLRNADLAMYQIKGKGRNGYCCFTEEMNKTNSYHFDIENSLHRAIENNELRLFYQPQLDLSTHRVVGVEALLRWKHPVRGLLYPEEFIPVAEQTKLICTLGNWVLEQACRDAVRLAEAGYSDLKMAINVSAQQLELGHFDRDFLDILGKFPLDPTRLEIEITESSLMQDMDKSMRILTTLATHDVRIAVDDFGTGYSSLSYLQTLPIHTLKIDRSFVMNIAPRGEGQNTIITAILAIAKGLDLNFIAEGVENSIQEAYLREAGCLQVQGFHYSQPIGFNKLLAFLGQWTPQRNSVNSKLSPIPYYSSKS